MSSFGVTAVPGAPSPGRDVDDGLLSNINHQDELHTHKVHLPLDDPFFDAIETVAKDQDERSTSLIMEGKNCATEGEVDVLGIIAIVVFYLAVLLVGIYAGWKQKKKGLAQNEENVMLAGRDIGLFVGVLTMGATWVGGGFINGSAEEVYKSGLIWTQAPFGYGLSLFISGTFFAKTMRESEYVTMVDPFTQKYGKWGSLQAIPAAVSEIFWSASILGALGSTLQVILKVDQEASIISSAVIAVCYTLFGGLLSVSYTDVIQIFFIAIGLLLAIPYAIQNPAVANGTANVYRTKIEGTQTPAWYGEVAGKDWGVWIDYAFLLLLGGIPWQCYYQRVLSSKSAVRAQLLSYGGGVIALMFTGPAVMFGAIARETDWAMTDYTCGKINGKIHNTSIVVPLVLKYLTPSWVSFFGLGAISAAVMSSTDSSMLSASTMLARNVYKKVFRPNCSEKEVIWALWVLIVFNCVVATSLAIVYPSIYDLFVLCGDFVFVIVFPQLLLVIHWEKSNTYGSVISYFITLILRLLCGESKLGIPSTISFGKFSDPDWEACTGLAKKGDILCSVLYKNDVKGMEDCQYEACTGEMPFRTIVMLISLVLHLIISATTHHFFTNHKVDITKDFLNVFQKNHQTGEVSMRTSRHLKQSDSVDLNIPMDKLEVENKVFEQEQNMMKHRDEKNNSDTAAAAL